MGRHKWKDGRIVSNFCMKCGRPKTYSFESCPHNRSSHSGKNKHEFEEVTYSGLNAVPYSSVRFKWINDVFKDIVVTEKTLKCKKCNLYNSTSLYPILISKDLNKLFVPFYTYKEWDPVNEKEIIVRKILNKHYHPIDKYANKVKIHLFEVHCPYTQDDLDIKDIII